MIQRPSLLDVVCLAAIAIGAFFYVQVVKPLEREADSRRESAAIARARADAAPSTVLLAPEAAVRLRRFHEFFRRDADPLTDTLARIYNLAAGARVELGRGEYRTSRIAELRLESVEATFPVKAGYLQIREFITAVLEANPNVALEQVKLARGRVQDTLIDAEIRVTIFVPAE